MQRERATRRRRPRARLRAPRRPALATAGLALTLVVGGALRFATLDVQSLWLDEAVTVGLVRRGLGQMLAAIPASESTPPLYYVLAWGWTRAFGTSAVGLRSLSALLGTATIPLAYAVAARLGDRRAGLVAAALAATSPLLIWYSQEARAYALLVALSAVGLLCFVRALGDASARGSGDEGALGDASARGSGGEGALARGGSRGAGGQGRWLAGWALASALALATHYFAVFPVAAEGAWLLVRLRRRPAVRRAALAVGAVVLALAPLALAQAGDQRAGFIRDTPLAQRVIQVPKQLLIGYRTPDQALLAALAVAAVLAALALLVARGRPAWLRAAVPVAGVGLAAAGVPILAALAGVDFLVTRNVLAAWLPAMVVVALGLTAGRGRAGAAGALAAAALCAIGLVAFARVEADPTYQRADWRDAARALGAPHAPRAVVAAAGAGLPLRLYLPGAGPLPPGGVAVSEVDLLSVRTRIAQQAGAQLGPATPVPPGFALAGVQAGAGYVLARLRAPRPVALPAAALARLAGDGSPAGVLVQAAAATAPGTAGVARR